ncbi:prepilin-type N-terminal cleavage/methylation domain-containing protein [Neobacillus niacini]|uniref:prepilin-type N-terminal cleavage/methylation domain-containing protein n=1 Tax=Neobacillus niacini TaxID=86668 RepID=UPI0007AB8B65|nr:prepilin-type N-terminal cleavage/methylation domain-containing protein [Neobacillus niacini]MEC1521776.1 prepilin-type N-terminal cleavage/methylation domain-containing protein [Neobacillus niacini]
MNENERGVTLIELLAVVSIISIIGVVIWGVFFQGIQYSQKSFSKNFMIQETNIILTNLIKNHQTVKSYDIENPSCKIVIKSRLTADPTVYETVEYSHPKICINLEIKQADGSVIKSKSNIIPSQASGDTTLTIIASDKVDPANKVSIEAQLYRLKGADY